MSILISDFEGRLLHRLILPRLPAGNRERSPVRPEPATLLSVDGTVTRYDFADCRRGRFQLKMRVSLCCMRALPAMRHLVAILALVFACSTTGLASVNFSGVWTLDLKASDSPEQMMKEMGVPMIHRKFASSTKLEATYHQSANILTVTSRAPGFSRVETFYLDGRTETKTEKHTGPYTIRTAWSKDGKQLISTSDFRTKHGKPGELIVARKLTNGGNTLVLT
jgi:hypothetical protein